MDKLDAFDIAILRELQRDASQTAGVIGEKINLSTSQAHRRIKRLEASGLITGYVACLQPSMLGLHINAMVTIKVHQDTPQTKKQLADFVNGHDCVLECWTVVGDKYAILRIISYSMASFSRFISNDLMALKNVASSESVLFMEPLKTTSNLPIANL